mmetsp:Transcript_21105/g.47858  ORF Transcript_21105/g.47858 Transcript_21105/m.47858 type:complete len:208 (-) Transcript_21105:28-651(-)
MHYLLDHIRFMSNRNCTAPVAKSVEIFQGTEKLGILAESSNSYLSALSFGSLEGVRKSFVTGSSLSFAEYVSCQSFGTLFLEEMTISDCSSDVCRSITDQRTSEYLSTPSLISSVCSGEATTHLSSIKCDSENVPIQYYKNTKFSYLYQPLVKPDLLSLENELPSQEYIPAEDDEWGQFLDIFGEDEKETQHVQRRGRFLVSPIISI